MLERRGWRLGLDRMQAYIELLELGDGIGPNPKFVHVTGTNGKGSVTCYVQNALEAQGFNVGAFYSPYVFTARERIQQGLDYISEEDFVDLVSRLLPVGEQLTLTEVGGPTEFETKAAMGFQFWKEKGCEWVALEVGLGGRLDATNVIDPAVSVIVTISLDHTRILGESVEEIAEEKAGIIKPGRPVVIGEVPATALDIFLEKADRLGCEAWVYGRDFFAEVGETGAITVRLPEKVIEGIWPGMAGEFQLHNVAVALASLEIAGGLQDEEAVKSSVTRARLPGRMQKIFWQGFELMLDGAHNPAAAKSLAESVLPLKSSGKGIEILASQVSGHDTLRVFSELKVLSDRIHLCPVDFFRARPIEELIDAAQEAGFSEIVVSENSTEALEKFQEHLSPFGLGLICGSFYLLGELGEALGATV